MMAGIARSSRIRNELVFGFVAVILLSGLATYAVVLSSFRRDFDALVRKNDVEIAASFAESLAKYYEAEGSWAGVERKIDELRAVSRPPFPRRAILGPTRRSIPGTRISPLVLTDAQGDPIYVGMRSGEGSPGLPNRMQTAQGAKVVAHGATVAYVFFKSMIFRSYNSQESAYIASLTGSLRVSVLISLGLALLLGTLLASRFARPIVALDSAVKTIAEGRPERAGRGAREGTRSAAWPGISIRWPIGCKAPRSAGRTSSPI